MSALAEYKVRVKHKNNDAHWEATVIASGVLVAALWFKQYTRSEDMPVVFEKNGKPYKATGGNRAYARAHKIALNDKRKGKLRLSKEDVAYLKEKDAQAMREAKEQISKCELIEEKPFVIQSEHVLNERSDKRAKRNNKGTKKVSKRGK